MMNNFNTAKDFGQNLKWNNIKYNIPLGLPNLTDAPHWSETGKNEMHLSGFSTWYAYSRRVSIIAIIFDSKFCSTQMWL